MESQSEGADTPFWRRIPKRVSLKGVALIVLTIVTIVIIAAVVRWWGVIFNALKYLVDQIYQVPWTGFGETTRTVGENQQYTPAKTFWDWLELLIVPAVITGSAIFFGGRERRKERREQQQQALTTALQGEKQSIGLISLWLVDQPQLMNKSNRTELLMALCMAYVFVSSSRARALVAKVLRKLSSENNETYKEITNILDDVLTDFRRYDAERLEGKAALETDIERVKRLKRYLQRFAAKPKPKRW